MNLRSGGQRQISAERLPHHQGQYRDCKERNRRAQTRRRGPPRRRRRSRRRWRLLLGFAVTARPLPCEVVGGALLSILEAFVGFVDFAAPRIGIEPGIAVGMPAHHERMIRRLDLGVGRVRPDIENVVIVTFHHGPLSHANGTSCGCSWCRIPAKPAEARYTTPHPTRCPPSDREGTCRNRLRTTPASPK